VPPLTFLVVTEVTEVDVAAGPMVKSYSVFGTFVMASLVLTVVSP
jgi:hypothetical protein